jgi:cyclophilin family peptidyl-prolyl cis-trans isomerase
MKRALIAAFALGVFAAGTARAANPFVVIETSMGTIKVELFEDKAPITVKNFLGYVDDKHFDGTIFHRVIDGFMIQGGGYTADKKLKDTKPPIKNEWQNGLSNTRGTLAMARTNDPDSATDQFFINVADNSRLDKPNPNLGMTAGYAVFGKVMEGMDVVDKIKATKTDQAEIEVKLRTGDKMMAPTPNVPVTNVVIKTIRRADK